MGDPKVLIGSFEKGRFVEKKRLQGDLAGRTRKEKILEKKKGTGVLMEVGLTI